MRSIEQALIAAAERSGFSRRLAALANAANSNAGTDSKTQKRSGLARRKAVGWNPLLGGDAKVQLLNHVYYADDGGKLASDGE